VIGSLGLTHLLLPGFSVDEHDVASRRASSRSRHWWTQARPPHPFLPRLHRPRHGRAGLTTSSTAAITTTTREDRLPSPLMAYDAAAAPPIFWRMAIRHRRAAAGRPTPGRAATKQVNRAGGLRRAARRAALVRPVPLHPVRERRRRDRRLRRLGHLTTGAADVQRPTSEPPRIDVQPTSTGDSWTA
jgi:hypothetical protein